MAKGFYRFVVSGVVQGVGFRPYIYRAATERGLRGYVKNIGAGVEVVVDDGGFLSSLDNLPPLARITGHTRESFEGEASFSEFSILESEAGVGETELPPDIFTCPECLAELRDEKNRRHGYYFITCTNCGPRMSIIEDYPYDRPTTSMADFEMCADCRQEYTNPLDRRYHAQTVACKRCGPRLKLLSGGKDATGKTDRGTIKKAVSLIKKGEFVSIKGVGGFHICCRAKDDAVSGVRDYLHRPDKPFALLVRDVAMAADIVQLARKERELLESPARPIVVCRKKDPRSYPSVSELDSLGVMLPYTALHALLFDHVDEPLVLTSANVPGDPVALDESVGRHFLTHERRIVNRADDSVLKVVGDETLYLRRSRGYVPLPVPLPAKGTDVLAVGAEMNNAVAAAKKDKCYLSQYLGTTDKLANQEFMRQAIDRIIRLTRLTPKIVAADLHPGYYSTQYAKELADRHDAQLIQVQHHHAHIASVAAEHGGIADYVGIACDGTGYGADGTVWGGEVLSVTGHTGFERIGSLRPQPQLGGDAATRHPKRMLFGILSTFLSENELLDLALFSEKESGLYLNQLADGFNVPQTTSTGRVLDAAAAFLGLLEERTYDGRPAMLLESAATDALSIEPVFSTHEGRRILDTNALFRFLLDHRNEEKGKLAATAQDYVARGLFAIACQKTEKRGVPIVCSGGVTYNRQMTEYFLENGVLVNHAIPAGDGGTCYGQAYLAALLAEESS